MMLYGVINFVLIFFPNPFVAQDHSFAIQDTKHSVEMTNHSWMADQSKQNVFITGHILVFLCGALLMIDSRQNRSQAGEDRIEPSEKDQSMVFHTDTFHTYSYNGPDHGFWYRAIRSWPFILYMLTGFPVLLAGFFYFPLLLIALFLSLNLINVIILERYYLISVIKDQDFVTIEYYHFLKKQRRSIPFKEFSIQFESRVIKMNIHYELIFMQGDSILMKQRSNQKPFTYPALEGMFKNLSPST
jgi:hypothetical protein